MVAALETSVLLANLQNKQQQMLNACETLFQDLHRQWHPDLSPAGWHLGHCVFIENYWVREQLLKREASGDELTALYNPFNSEKSSRGTRLPSRSDLFLWASQSQTENLALLDDHLRSVEKAGLLYEDFLLHFLVQHYAQHYETLKMISMQMQLNAASEHSSEQTLESRPLNKTAEKIPAGRYRVGIDHLNKPYDNEYPAFDVELDDVSITRRPVSQGEYLSFMQAGGYHDPKWWTEEGWVWKQSVCCEQPEYWCRNGRGWFGITPHGTEDLLPHKPVCGISWYEAMAFARWAGARLPHEHEWEVASRLGLLESTSEVWEWCHNCFFPYPGFTPYPYDGYSLPYFDNNHYCLRGGSRYTEEEIKRPSFRNYYEPDKRFLCSGLRLVFIA